MDESFLWHKVSEQEKQEIKKQAKQIMESFSKKLAGVDKKIKDLVIERGSGMRKESKGEEIDVVFREKMFENAPNKNKDFVIAEKKKW